MTTVELILLITLVGGIFITIMVCIAKSTTTPEEIQQEVEATWIYKRMYIGDEFKGIIQIHQESIDNFEEMGCNVHFEDLLEEDYE